MLKPTDPVPLYILAARGWVRDGHIRQAGGTTSRGDDEQERRRGGETTSWGDNEEGRR